MLWSLFLVSQKKNEQKKSQQLSWPVGLSSPLFINDHFFASVYYSLWVWPAFLSCKHPGHSSLLMKTQCFILNAPATQLSQQGGSCLRQMSQLALPRQIQAPPSRWGASPRRHRKHFLISSDKMRCVFGDDPDVLAEANKWNVWT